MICWFSHGCPSAVASKRAVELYSESHEVLVVNCDTKASEHPDNYRFGDQCEKWIGQPIIHLRNEDYRTVDDVFEKTKYMAGVNGARCTTELKKIPRLKFQRPDDVHVFGLTFDEHKRIREFRSRNPELLLKWVLVELGLTKADCLWEVKKAGIQEPQMYQLGFDNNNCPGCVKASSPWYWDMTRKHFPAVFLRRCEQSRKLGVRLVEISHHKRIFLDELPPGPFSRPKKKERLSCGPECGYTPKLL